MDKGVGESPADRSLQLIGPDQSRCHGEPMERHRWRVASGGRHRMGGGSKESSQVLPLEEAFLAK